RPPASGRGPPGGMSAGCHTRSYATGSRFPALRALLEKRVQTWEPGGVAQLLLDPQQPVVLGDAIGARGGAGLDLAGTGGDSEVGDGGVLGLARAVGDHRGVAGLAGGANRLQGLREGADLVD